MPKVIQPKRMRRPANNTTFRESLGLSTLKADLHRFHLLRDFLRAQVRKHFDYTVPYQSQTAERMASFETEVTSAQPQLYASDWRRAQTRAYVESYYHNERSRVRRAGQSDDGVKGTMQTPSAGNEDSSESDGSQVDELAGDTTAHPTDEPSSLPTPPATPPLGTSAVRRFLRSCQPSLEHLLPFFMRLGIRTRSELAGVMRWPAYRRDAWLRELRREEEWAEFGLTRVQIQALSLAFVFSDEVVAICGASGE